MALALIGAVGIAALAVAESSRQGGLLVSFNGRIEPTALPRLSPAPVRVVLAGSVRGVGGTALPQLRQIVIAINRSGEIDFRGLAVCRHGQIRSAGASTALRVCGRSLVGHGRFVAQVAFPEQPSFRVVGRLHAFNGRYRGRRAILAHVFTRLPTPIAVTVPLTINRRGGGGAYGTTLRSPPLPELFGPNVYATDFRFDLGRRFRARGAPRSYFSAACAAAPGFPGAVFTFARATFRFKDNRTVRQTLTRACRVRGGG